MENVSIHWARDLPASTRSAIESLFGRDLRDDEEVSVMSLSSHSAPSGDERRLSAERLRGALDRVAEKAGDADGDAFDAAVDEAMNHVRPRRR
jgi:hypothetical protein